MGDNILLALGWIMHYIVLALNYLLTYVIGWIVQVASWDNFTTLEVVSNGWIMVRDLSNMFFVLIILIIAFATVLRIENYNYQKLLPKLVILAVLINFSKTICGLLIDFTQVIMLTFVNGFANGVNSLTMLFGMDRMLDFAETNKEQKGGFKVDIFAGLVVAFLASVIAFVTIVTVLGVLIMRAVMIWIYVILSPLAYVLGAIPAGQSYAQKWWSEFTKNLITGPLLAFFIWLAISSSRATSAGLGTSKVSGQGLEEIASTEFLTAETFQTYIVVIGLLLGGLILTQELGGAAGKAAGKGISSLQKGGSLVTKGASKASRLALRGAMGAARGTAKLAGAGISLGARELHYAGGPNLRFKKIFEGVKKAIQERNEDKDSRAKDKSAEQFRKGGFRGTILGTMGAPEDATKAFLSWQGFRNVGRNVSRKRNRQKLEGARLELEKVKEKSISDEYTDEDKVKEVKKVNKNIDALSQKARPFSTRYADAERISRVRQAGKDIDGDNAEELHSDFMSAMETGDVEFASRMMIHAAKVGHSNEILELTKSLENVYSKDSDGNKYISVYKDENFNSGQDSLTAFIEQYLIGKMNMSKREALSTQSLFSSAAKSAGHHNLAESVGVKDGEYFSRTAENQTILSNAEVKKTDSEKHVRGVARLGNMDEKQYIDPDTGLEERRAIATNLTVLNFKAHSKGYNTEIDRSRANPNNFENMYKNYGLSIAKPELFVNRDKHKEKNIAEMIGAKVDDDNRIIGKGSLSAGDFEILKKALAFGKKEFLNSNYAKNDVKVQRAMENDNIDHIKLLKKAVAGVKAAAK